MQRTQLDILKRTPLTNQDVYEYLQACMQILLVRITEGCRTEHAKLFANTNTVNEAIFREIFIRKLFGEDNGEIENELLKYPADVAKRDLFLHFKSCLRTHWNIIRQSPKLHYQYRPDLWINRVCVQLALLCEAGLGESSASLLYPDLQSTYNAETDFSVVDTSRLPALPPVQANVVISECGTYFIEVDVCFELLKRHGELRHTQVNKPLTAAEIQSVRELTRHADTAFETYTEWYKLHISEVSLGGCIAVLIKNLRDGGANRESSSRTGVNANAGEQALTGVAIFKEILDKLTPEMKSRLFAMRNDENDFAYYYDSMYVKGECVETTASHLSKFLEKNRDALYGMMIGRCESVTNQIATLDRRYEENLTDLYHYFEVIHPYLMTDATTRKVKYPNMQVERLDEFSNAIYLECILSWLATNFKKLNLFDKIKILSDIFEKHPFKILESELLIRMTDESLRLLVEHFPEKSLKRILLALYKGYELETDHGEKFIFVLERCQTLYKHNPHLWPEQKHRALTNLARLYFALPNYNPLVILDGYKMLEFAVEKRNATLTAYLLAKGANPQVGNLRHVIEVAIERKHFDCAKILIPTINGYSLHTLELTLAWSSTYIINLLFNRFVEIGWGYDLAERCLTIALSTSNHIALQFALEKGAKSGLDKSLLKLYRNLWNKCLGMMTSDNCASQAVYIGFLQRELPDSDEAKTLKVILKHTLNSEETNRDIENNFVQWLLQHIDLETFADVIKPYMNNNLAYKGLFYLADLMTTAQRQHLMQHYFVSGFKNIIEDHLPIMKNKCDLPLLLEHLVRKQITFMRYPLILLLIHHPELSTGKTPILHLVIPNEPILFDLLIREMRGIDINAADEFGNTAVLLATAHYKSLPMLKRLVELKARLTCTNNSLANIFHAAECARVETLIYLLETEFSAAQLSDDQIPDSLDLPAFNKACKKRMLLAENKEGKAALSRVVLFFLTLHEQDNYLLQLLIDTVGLEALLIAIDKLDDKSISRLLQMLNKEYDRDTLTERIIFSGAANVATIFFRDVKLNVECFEAVYGLALESVFKVFIKKYKKTDNTVETRSAIRCFLLIINNLPKFRKLTNSELALLKGGEVAEGTLPDLLIERVICEITTALMVTSIHRFIEEHTDNRQLLFIMAGYFHLMTTPQRECFVEEFYPAIEAEMFDVRPCIVTDWDYKLYELVKSDAPRSTILLLLQKKHTFNASYTPQISNGESALHMAVGKPGILEDLLSFCRYDTSITNNNNETPLDLAVRRGCIISTGKLLKHGADPTLSCYAGCQLSSLMYAAKMGKAKIFHLILAHLTDSRNAELIEMNRQGENALTFACISADHHLLVGLKFNKRYLNMINPITKKSILMCAASAGRFRNVAILVMIGCQIDLVNNAGKTASDFALEAKHIAIATFLDFVQRKSLQAEMNAHVLYSEKNTPEDIVIYFIAAHSNSLNSENYLHAVRLAAQCGRVKMLMELLPATYRIQGDILREAKSYQHETRDIILAIILRKLLLQLLAEINKESNPRGIYSLFKNKQDQLKSFAHYNFVDTLAHMLASFINDGNPAGYRFEERVVTFVTGFQSNLSLSYVREKRLAHILICALGNDGYESLLRELEKPQPNRNLSK